MRSGIEIRKAHFPGRAPLDAYGNGGFRFADMSHRGSLLCLPSGIYGWEHTIPIPNITDFARIFNEAKDIDILFIGTGIKRLQLAAETIGALGTHNIVFELMDTGAAARSFNILLSEERAVAAALTAVD